MTAEDLSCGRFQDDLPELALGILTGRERGATLIHLESCVHCLAELNTLALVADRMLELAPDLEPRPGFYRMVVERFGVG